MSHVSNESTIEAVRLRLQFLYGYHKAAVRSGDERLRAAMAEYAQSLYGQQEREAA